jgi:hypothetical protein
MSDDEHISDDLGTALVRLARQSVELFVVERRMLTTHDTFSDLRSACFVSIKKTSGELRGCIGTIEPTQPSLVEEVIRNAISAATSDPRFDPISGEELSSLVFSVDVLSVPIPARLEELDPSRFGLIVEDEQCSRRGLLLPNIEGVVSTEQQLAIAARKGGITDLSKVRLSKFEVQRFRESDQIKRQDS